ncbi:MAG: hypothetical protein EOO08_14850 [Chitinophagaceae bacterium]|nr:MAG: hypothetical protein EOO08_14850 [Chitinophagaceae bacterium]
MKLTASFRFAAIPVCAALALALASCHHNDDIPAPATPVVTSPVDSSTVAIDTAHWTYFGAQSSAYSAPVPGKFEFNSEGVKAYAESYRYGAFLLTNQAYTTANRTIKIAWKPVDGGAFSDHIFSFADSTGMIYNANSSYRGFEDLNNLTTQSSYNNSVIITSGVWYYTTIVTTGNHYVITTATGNYASSNGSVVETRTGTFTRTRARIALRNGDPFGGTASSITIHELNIR